MEAAELAKALEEEWGVSAAAAVAVEIYPNLCQGNGVVTLALCGFQDNLLLNKQVK